MSSADYGANSITYTDSNGNTQTISVDVENGEINFGNLDLVAKSISASGGTTVVGIGGGSSGSAIETISITIPGSGFSDDETGSFYNKSSSGSGATFRIDSVNANGGPTSIEITNGGSGYAVGDVLYINEEAESGETRPEITVTAVS